MKTISNILLILLAATGVIIAQGDARPDVGFIRIVNAISPGTGNASFFIDGRDLYSGGYAIGQTTGGYGVKAGKLEIEVRKQGVETARTRVNLGVGETLSVIAFAERLPQEKNDEPPRWVVRLLRLKQQEIERGYGLSFISVCRPQEVPVEVTVEGRDRQERVFAKRMRITMLEMGRRRGEIMIRNGERVLANISPDSPGNYVVILFENIEGHVEAISYYDPRFVIAG